MGGATKYFYRPKKIKFATNDSVLHYYSSKANNARFFLVDSSYDELSRKTNYFYDNQGNLDSLQYYQRVLADGGGGSAQDVTTKFTHNSTGNLTQIEDPEGHKQIFKYSTQDTGAYMTEARVDIAPSGQGNEDLVTQYRYNDNRGVLDTLIYYHDYPNNSKKVKYYYDVFKRPYKISHPGSRDEKHTYDKRGNVLVKKIETANLLPEAYKMEYFYDARDHLVHVNEYESISMLSSKYDSTYYAYNLNDALVEFTNANHEENDTSTTIYYGYTAGRLCTTKYADTTRDTLEYYKSGYLKFKKDRKGQVIDYHYDNNWRLTKKRYFDDWASYPNSPSDSVVFWLDKVGMVDSLLDKNGKIKYDYDDLDRMFELNAYDSKMVKYLFDKVSNKTRLKVCNASDTTNVYLLQTYPSYDEGNRLEKTIVSPDTFEFSYWDVGQLKEIIYHPNDLKEQFWLTNRNLIDSMRTYDANNDTSLFKFSYWYNVLNDRDSMDFEIGRPSQVAYVGIYKYKYDCLRRLTESQVFLEGVMTSPNKYSYDAVGNRLSKDEGFSVINYNYDRRNNQLKSAGATSYSYDNNGNLTQISPPSLENFYLSWDHENRLTKVKRTNGTNDSLGFTYCGLGKRIKKIHHGADDTTRYCYDGMYAVCEYGNTDTLKSAYVYANGLMLARYDADGDTFYCHHDGLGSIMGLTDDSKNVDQSYHYEEFGNLEDEWGSVANHYRYTGQEYDDEITNAELYNLRARYYEPGIGRFISEDPIEQAGYVCPRSHTTKLPQALNLYPYVQNNPVNFTDPLGLRSCFIQIISGSGGGSWSFININVETGVYEICCTKNSDARCGYECRKCGFRCYGGGLGVGVPLGPSGVSVSGGAQVEIGPWFGDIPECTWGLQLSGMAMAGKGISGSAVWAPGVGGGIAGGGGAGAGAGISIMYCTSWEFGVSGGAH